MGNTSSYMNYIIYFKKYSIFEIKNYLLCIVHKQTIAPSECTSIFYRHKPRWNLMGTSKTCLK